MADRSARMAAINALDSYEDPKVSSKGGVAKVFATCKALKVENEELASKKRSFEGAYNNLSQSADRLKAKLRRLEDELEQVKADNAVLVGSVEYFEAES